MAPAATCRVCGAPLPIGSSGTVCPACLFEIGLDPEPSPDADPDSDLDLDPDPDRDRNVDPVSPKPDHPSAEDRKTETPLRRMGDYDLMTEIGRGGMGIVYRARQRRLDRIVAVKLLLTGSLASPEAVQRFQTEARTTARLHHPHIVATHDFGVIDGQPYLSMDWVDGPHLGTLVREHALPPERAATYLRKIAAAVQHAHDHGVLHRDLKPSNILLDADEEPRLTDFGLAKRLGQAPDLTQTGQTLGSPSYMAPEQASGQVTAIGPGVDVYALGAILYHLLTGRPPFLAASLTSTLRQVLEKEPVPPRLLNPTIPRDLEVLCLRCLAKSPQHRLASAGELAAELERFLSGNPIHARPPGFVERFVRWRRRNPRIAALGSTVALLVLALAVGIPLAMVRIDRERRAALRASETATRHEQAARAALYRLEWQRAEDLFARDDSAAALATLASLLRDRPQDRSVATRLLHELTYRNHALLILSPLLHEEPVHGVVFSPDGRRLLSTTRDNRAHLWEASTGRRIAVLPHRSEVVERGDFNEGLHPILARWSPDGRWIVTASADRTARIWDGSTGQPATEPIPHPDWVVEACFSPDSRLLATGDRAGAIRLWAVHDGLAVGSVRQHDNWVNALQFSPDGAWLLSASDDGTARLWEVAKEGPANRIFPHPPVVRAAVLSPDARRVATGSSSGTARLWDALTGEPLGEPMAHESRINTVEFSPDGTRLATTSADRTARLWTVPTGRSVGRPLHHHHTVRGAHFSPEGGRLVTVSEDGTARLWDAQTGAASSEPIRHRDAVWEADFSPDGTRLITASSDRTVCLWDVRAGQADARALHGFRRPLDAFWSTNQDVFAALCLSSIRVLRPAGFPSIRFDLQLEQDADLSAGELSSDGRFAVTGGLNGTVCLWETTTGRRIAGPFLHHGIVHSTRFAPGSDRLVTASADHTVEVRDVPSGTLRFPALRLDEPLFDAAFDPSGRWIAIAGADHTARLIDAHSGEPLGDPLRHDHEVLTVRFSPDSRHLLARSRDGTARIWDLATRTVVGVPLRHGGRIRDAEFSPDGRLVLTASQDGSARLWSTETGRPFGEPLIHEGALASARFDATGRRVVTASDDGTSRVWDVASGLPVSGAFPHAVRVNYARFSPDGRWIATADESRYIRFFEVVDAPETVPLWLPELAEAVAGIRFDTNHQRLAVSPTNLIRRRNQFASVSSRDPATDWARWFFADRHERALSPTAPWSVAQWATSVSMWGYPEGNRFQPQLGIRALAHVPENPDLLVSLARSLVFNLPPEDPEALARAEWLSRHALSLAPDSTEAWRTRALVLDAAGRLDEALGALDQGLRRAPRNGYLLWTNARLLAKARRFPEADAAFAQAAQAIGRPEWQGYINLPIVQLNWADCLESAGRTQEAVQLRLAARQIPPRPSGSPREQVDLSAAFNGGLVQPWLFGSEAEALAPLRSTRGIFQGVAFDCRGVVQLRSVPLDQGQIRYPGRVADIPVDLRCRRLHILHGATQTEDPGRPIAAHTVRFEDGTRVEIPIVYGRDVLAWTREPPANDAPPQPAWTTAGVRNPTVSLYLTTWENPRPDVVIASIDLASLGTRSGPFVVAITLEP